jgi:hypothetical protein
MVMSSLLVARAARYVDHARGAMARAPVEVAIAVFLAASFSYAIETRSVEHAWFETAVVATLIASAAWGATLLHAAGTIGSRARWTFTLGAAALAGIYGATVADFSRVSEIWRAFLLLGAALCALVAAPAFAAGGEARIDVMRRMNGRLVLRMVGVGVYAAALYAGLALALAAVDTLFELELRGQLYAHVFAWIFLALVPWVIVGGLPDYVRSENGDDRVAAVVHRISGFLVPPLLAVYLAILVAYVVRIAVTGEVPKNLVSPMVTAAGGLAIVALLLFDPRPMERSTLRWLRGVPVLLFPLAALGVWSIGLRIAQYGWTEFRAIRVAILGVMMILAASAVWDMGRRRRFALYAAPGAFAFVLVAVAVGPWSVLAIAERSQQSRLTAALTAAGVDTADPPAGGGTEVEVPAPVYDDVRTTAHYLRLHFGAASLPPAFAAVAASDGGYSDFAELAGLRRRWGDDPRLDFVNARLAQGVRIESGAGEMFRVGLGRIAPGPRDASVGAPGVVQDGSTLRMNLPGGSVVADLTPLELAMRGLPERGAELPAGDALLVVTDAAGAPLGRLLLLDVVARWEDRTFRLEHLDGLVMLNDSISAAERSARHTNND